MAAVLIIHATGRWENAFRRDHAYLSEDFLAVLVNQLARFCVPLFVLLSGYGLASKYVAAWGERMDWPAGLREFYGRRFSKIGVPFLVWTLALLAIGGRFHFDAAADLGSFLRINVYENLVVLAPYLYKRGADYHFYFFVIILQLYLLFPFLLRAVLRLNPAGRLALLVALFVWQLVWTYPSVLIFRALDWPRPIFPTAFLVYWIFYFYAGVYFALPRPAPGARMPGRRLLGRGRVGPALGLTLLSFAAMLAEYLYRSYVDAEPGYYNHFSRWSVVVYSVACFALLAAYDEKVEAYFDRYTDARRWLKIAAAVTFTVYLIHTWILRGIELTFVARELFATIAALLVLSGLAAYGLHKIVKPAWLRTILGLP